MKLWLDDSRNMPYGFDVMTRSADVAIELLKTGLVTEVSLDHDLGFDDDLRELPSGQKVADFIEEQAHAGTLKRLVWQIHTGNPDGRKRMTQALQNADKYWDEQEAE